MSVFTKNFNIASTSFSCNLSPSLRRSISILCASANCSLCRRCSSSILLESRQPVAFSSCGHIRNCHLRGSWIQPVVLATRKVNNLRRRLHKKQSRNQACRRSAAFEEGIRNTLTTLVDVWSGKQLVQGFYLQESCLSLRVCIHVFYFRVCIFLFSKQRTAKLAKWTAREHKQKWTTVLTRAVRYTAGLCRLWAWQHSWCYIMSWNLVDCNKAYIVSTMHFLLLRRRQCCLLCSRCTQPLPLKMYREQAGILETYGLRRRMASSAVMTLLSCVSGSSWIRKRKN